MGLILEARMLETLFCPVSNIRSLWAWGGTSCKLFSGLSAEHMVTSEQLGHTSRVFSFERFI